MSVFVDLNITNSFITLEALVLLSINRMYNKKLKIMELSNLSRANALASEKKIMENLIAKIIEFPFDKSSAKIVVTYGEKEFILPIEFTPLNPAEIAQLTINRIESRIKEITKEITTL